MGKVTAYTELTELDGDEVFYVVDDDDGTPTSKKVTVENIGVLLIHTTLYNQAV